MRVKKLLSIVLYVSMSIAIMPILDLSTVLANDTMIYEWDFQDYSGDEAVLATGETSKVYAVSDHVLEIHLANGDSITENGLYWSTPGGTVSDDTTTVNNNRYIVFRPKYDGNLAITYKGSDNNSRNHPRIYLSCGDAISCIVKGTSASQKEPNQMYDNNSLEFATGSYNVKSGNTYYIWGYHYSRTGTAFTVSNIVYNADTSTGQPQATSKPEDDALKLMALDFNDENDRLKTINGSVAVEQGQMAYSTGKDGTGCAYFNGTGAGWLDIKNSNGQGLLEGKDNITISFSSKTEAAPSWWMFAAPNSAAPVYQKEKYLGILKRNGIYYFMWSDNDTGEPTYEVRYGTSSSPYGSIQGNTRILTYSNTDDSRIRGTGHHSVVNVPGTDDWYICYHRFNVPRYGTVTSKNSEAGKHREICIEKMEFDENGNIKPVTATLKGITEPVTIER